MCLLSTSHFLYFPSVQTLTTDERVCTGAQQVVINQGWDYPLSPSARPVTAPENHPYTADVIALTHVYRIATTLYTIPLHHPPTGAVVVKKYPAIDLPTGGQRVPRRSVVLQRTDQEPMSARRLCPSLNRCHRA